ncbi:MAG: RIP metalloprotease RseP [Alphaproteobacteria bacterium]|nr:RIP metalloprotease RseP [Alphaproteobacteria bacterium]
MEFFSHPLGVTAAFLLVLTVLVFVHELGHFLVARRSGVKVEVFSIGFGKELWGFNDKHGTRWCFSIVPLGGYVKMFGEGDMITGVDDAEDRPMTEEEKKVSFHHKPLRQRAAIVSAGPIANFLFAVLMFWTVNTLYGVPHVLSAVGEVIEGSAAEASGFRSGDLITAIDAQPVELFSELHDIVSVNAGVELAFEVERDGAVIVIRATPRSMVDEQTGEGKGLLGVRPSLEHVRTEEIGIVKGLGMAVEQTYLFTANILSGLGDMVSGERSAKELGGVISIAQYSGEAAQAGMIGVLRFLAILSINLGLINLFPIPVLDGGHLVFYAAEALRGKPLSERVQEYGFRFGLVLVLLLMVFATWNDLERIVLGWG